MRNLRLGCEDLSGHRIAKRARFRDRHVVVADVRRADLGRIHLDGIQAAALGADVQRRLAGSLRNGREHGFLTEGDDGFLHRIAAFDAADPGPVAIDAFIVPFVVQLDFAAIGHRHGHVAGHHAFQRMVLAHGHRVVGEGAFTLHRLALVLVRHQRAAVRGAGDRMTDIATGRLHGRPGL